MITIVHGADTETADLAGRPVSEIRAAYANVFNIPADAIVKVNGQQVGEDFVVEDDAKIVFEKRADKYAA